MWICSRNGGFTAKYVGPGRFSRTNLVSREAPAAKWRCSGRYPMELKPIEKTMEKPLTNYCWRMLKGPTKRVSPTVSTCFSCFPATLVELHPFGRWGNMVVLDAQLGLLAQTLHATWLVFRLLWAVLIQLASNYRFLSIKHMRSYGNIYYV